MSVSKNEAAFAPTFFNQTLVCSSRKSGLFEEARPRNQTLVRLKTLVSIRLK